MDEGSRRLLFGKEPFPALIALELYAVGGKTSIVTELKGVSYMRIPYVHEASKETAVLTALTALTDLALADPTPA